MGVSFIEIVLCKYRSSGAESFWPLRIKKRHQLFIVQGGSKRTFLRIWIRCFLCFHDLPFCLLFASFLLQELKAKSQNCAKMGSDGVKMASRWRQDGPRWCIVAFGIQYNLAKWRQDGFRWGQAGVKMAERWPKMVPRWPVMVPRWPNMVPR